MPIYACVRGRTCNRIAAPAITTSYFHLSIDETFVCANVRATLVISFSKRLSMYLLIKVQYGYINMLHCVAICHKATKYSIFFYMQFNN